MTFDQWLDIAMRDLSGAAVERLVPEVSEHHDNALEDALLRGMTEKAAARFAVESLGDPQEMNKWYRKSYLTQGDERYYEFCLDQSEDKFMLQIGLWYVLLFVFTMPLDGKISRFTDVFPPFFWVVLLALYRTKRYPRIKLSRVFLDAGIHGQAIVFAVFCLSLWTGDSPFLDPPPSAWNLWYSVAIFFYLLPGLFGIFSYRRLKRIEDLRERTLMRK